MSIKTYRPPFTLVELNALKDACIKVGQLSLAKYLEHKIYIYENDLGKPAYTRTPKETQAQKLGFESAQAEYIPESLNVGVLLSKYADSGLQGFNVAQIEKVQQHRYENDMMDKEEEKEWEKLQGCR